MSNARKAALIGAGLLIVILQSFFGQSLEIRGVVPDIALVYLVFVGLFRGSKSGLGVALAAGLYADLLLGTYIGEYTLFYVLSAYLTGVYRHNFYYSNIQISLAFVALITLLRPLFTVLQNVILFSSIGPFNAWMLLGTLIYNLAFSCLFYRIFIRDWTGFENERE